MQASGPRYAVRSLGTRRPCTSTRSGLGGDGKPWPIATEIYGDRDILPRDVINRKLSSTSPF